MPILGLLNTESDANWRQKNIRRQVFYQYPNGKAPLTGILSLAQEEDTDDPEFAWWEKRMGEQRSLTKASATIMLTAAGVDITADQTVVAGTEYFVRLTASANDHRKFRIGHVIRMQLNVAGGASTTEVRGVVTDVSNADMLKFRALNTTASLDLASGDNNAKEVLVIGSAYSQGYTDQNTTLTSTNTAAQPYTLPIKLYNYCQIFRSPFIMTGTALKTTVSYDDTGAYKDQAKEASVAHSIEMEKAFIFGVRYQDTATTPVTNFTGGILDYLTKWEAGTTYGNTAATTNAHDNKRIITLTSGLSEKAFDGYLERLFRTTNSTNNEKLVLCGSGYLSVLNQLYKSKSVLAADFPTKDAYGMSVVKHVCPFGTLFYKTHPLFSQNEALRHSALFLDVGNIRYRYVTGRDTELLKGRAPNDADYRKDEWLTECGLELRFPESFMFMQLQTVLDYLP